MKLYRGSDGDAVVSLSAGELHDLCWDLRHLRNGQPWRDGVRGRNVPVEDLRQLLDGVEDQEQP